MPKLFGYLRNLDAFPKTSEDFSVKTFQGAALTVLSLGVMSLLIWMELTDLLSDNLTEEIFVDTTRNPKMQINLDITVPTISCHFLSLDAMDSSGEQHLEIDHHIYKRRLDLEGNPIEEPKKEDITIPAKNQNETQIVANKTEECGSCYGAALDPKLCCNTCDEVREAYRTRRWAFPENPENISQCKDEKYKEKMESAFAEGCHIFGSLTVNRVSGSFHIAPGRSFSINHAHIHDVQPFSSTSFNMTHKIQKVTFGDSIEIAAYNPLKNTVAIAKEGSTMFQYHIKLVPTIYIGHDEKYVISNLYSVTKHQKIVSVISGESGMPGAFFQYELSPLTVKYTLQEKSFGHFLTNVCAIIGGVYTVVGLIDSLLFNILRIVKKVELGKFH